MKVRTKRKICIAIGAVALTFAFCVVGSMELFRISTGRGALYLGISLLIFFASWYKAGLFR